MKDLSFPDAIRYIFSPAIAYFYLLISDRAIAKNLLNSLAPLEIGFALIVLGVVVYLLYRPLIYNLIITRIQDRFRLKTDNYRTFLKKRYTIGTHEACLLWDQIKEEYLKDRYSADMRTFASGVHLLYLSGTVALPFLIWRLSIKDWLSSLLFVGVAAVCLTAAFLSDRYYEDVEMRLLRSLENSQLDLFANQVLGRRQT
ncbi:MAG: hypothetical protein ACE5JU_22490 [Candidatus Binatia bacterium]